MTSAADIPVTKGGLAAALVALWLFYGCAHSGALSTDAIRKAPLRLPGVGMITFTDGSYDARGADSVHIGQIDLFTFGDLDGDGCEDALTFLSSKGEGPELTISMEAFLNKDGTPVHEASYRIGDRIAIDSVTVDRRIVSLFIITQGPEDAPCCPTLHVKRKLVLDRGEFTEMRGE